LLTGSLYLPPFKDAFLAKSPSGMAYAAPFDAKNPSTLDLKWFHIIVRVRHRRIIEEIGELEWL
jgi:hypothetical protein